MRKIIHLSDLHIGYGDLGERFNCIVNNIIYLKEPAEQYVIVITGDIVDAATNPWNYDEAKTYFEKLEEAGFTVLVVPGNHDYGTGVWGSKRYIRLFKDTFFGNPQIEYPKLNILDEIAFIGLDSMAEELNWDDRMFAEGELGDAQLGRLDTLLDSDPVKACKYKVVYLHHNPHKPIPLHRLKDAEELGEILEPKKVDALLYGHNHAGGKQNGKWGIPRCYDGGTATRMLGGNCPHRVIDFARPNADGDARWDYDAEFLTGCGVFS